MTDMDDDEFDRFEKRAEKLGDIADTILLSYNGLVAKHHPDKLHYWPVVSGYDLRAAQLGDWDILIFTHTGKPGMMDINDLDQLSPQDLGIKTIDQNNIDSVRERIENQFDLDLKDAVVFLKSDYPIENELDYMLTKHELALGLAPVRIFLSHKGEDELLVRDFAVTLSLLGFEPWLYQEDMAAGVKLERGLRKGLQDSCAAVFFITPNFVDDDYNYLASEIDYALEETRQKEQRFVIISLILETDGKKGTLPEMLRSFVCKEPRTKLEALREIIKVIPIKVGRVNWKL